MPTSYQLYKDSIKNWILENVSLDAKILDVGAGCGTYSDLLRGYGYKMDAIEIWEPYIEKYNLKDKYDNVYLGSITEMGIDELSKYNFIILGDVLEHIDTIKAQGLIYVLSNFGKSILVAIPYQMEQGEHEGNIHETHLQPDLTPKIMEDRYPELGLLYGSEYYGYYINKKPKYEKAFILYADDSYFDLADACCRSIRNFSSYPILVYMLNSDKKVSVMNTITIRWDCDVFHLNKRKDFIDREDKQIYKLLIERPKIVHHALENYAEMVAYIDTDSVATKSVDSIFDYFDVDSSYPYFTEGIYEYLLVNGRGGADSRDDLSGTLEAPACELLGINQQNRGMYKQTGYFVAGQNCLDWLAEWSWLCQHPSIMRNNAWYAPFNEETIANVLLWKYKQYKGLPYCYINGLRKNLIFTGYDNLISDWVKIPATERQLLFFHGEKNIEKINEFIKL
tara:strand:- start:3542 stop:4894 length:1353 start_codon:yes stop_codon:yes gene_type:complete